MKITNHNLEGVASRPSPNRSGLITPKFIVFHYTASWTARSAISTLTNPKTRASAHLVIDLDGTVTQLVPFNRRAWHAGPSQYEGYENLNNHSIGIEIVNIGWLQKTSDGYSDPYGRRLSNDEVSKMSLVEFKDPAIGSGTYFQPLYPESQLQSVDKVVEAILEAYPDIEYLVGHKDIDKRGWKVDPGPAFPMTRYKMRLNVRGNPEISAYVSADRLNVRAGPGTRFNIITTLKKYTDVVIHEEDGDWVRINQGWVRRQFLRED